MFEHSEFKLFGTLDSGVKGALDYFVASMVRCANYFVALDPYGKAYVVVLW